MTKKPGAGNIPICYLHLFTQIINEINKYVMFRFMLWVPLIASIDPERVYTAQYSVWGVGDIISGNSRS